MPIQFPRNIFSLLGPLVRPVHPLVADDLDVRRLGRPARRVRQLARVLARVRLARRRDAHLS